MVTLSPAFLLLTLTYFLSFDVQQVLLAVFDHDRTTASRRYVASLASHENVHLSGYVSSQEELNNWLLSGRVRAVVVIPPGFEKALGRRQVGTVQIVLDGTNPTVAREAEARAQASTRSFLVQAGLLPHATPGEMLDLRIRVWYNPGLRSWFSIVPGLIGVVLCMQATSMALALAREREHGTMEGLLATPITGTEVVVGKLVPYVVTGLFSGGLATLVATVWFQVPFRGSWALYALLMVDFLLALLSLSLLVSSFLSSQQAAMIAVFLLFFLPSFFLSGLTLPISRRPSLSWLGSYGLPTTYFVTVCRGLFLKGVGLISLWLPALALAGIAAVALTLSIVTFRKKVR